MNKKFLPYALVAALLLAALAGFGLARLGGKGDSATPVAAAPESKGDAANAGKTPEGEAEGEESGHAHEEGEKDDDEGLVELTAEQRAASGIEVVAVTSGGGGETRLSGRVEPTVGARAAVAAAVDGRVERVVVAPGMNVAVGAPIAYIVSGEGASLRAAADAAAAEAQVARMVHQRDRSLVGQGVVARQEMEASRARSLAADATARAAQARLAATGRPDGRGRIAITSPVRGVVTGVQVTPGGFVAAGNVVASVSDPRQTEIVFNAPPALASRVQPGMRIEVTGPDGAFPAVVTASAADVNEPTGMAVVRARAEEGVLPPAGSPVAGILVTGDLGGMFSVPTDAVQAVNGSTVVFVATDKGFRATPVLAGRRAGNRVEILKGLKGTERVAGTNAFLLKAELAKGEAEHGH
ncbi:efflux RND transporter periplasmic adaptor subunit [Lysobacter pythonis]|uniref:Efflux RND transporter periplasmic adaptor subunit n=1 Tax=Solilutibacter pythonis TaxID=2483112 RepID=A0A3M2HTF1_9GAMM|nr:efflux RND transporter periplasmic adaptor subunit [Lysobacter pythonis]RMH90950.1 efflux RND transporter periplasmic adaptor subunit [Lysobacter pythonis]